MQFFRRYSWVCPLLGWEFVKKGFKWVYQAIKVGGDVDFTVETAPVIWKWIVENDERVIPGIGVAILIFLAFRDIVAHRRQKKMAETGSRDQVLSRELGRTEKKLEIDIGRHDQVPSIIKPGEEAKWCPRTSEELVKLVSGKTDYAAEQSIKPYLGQWLRFRGDVVNVKIEDRGTSVTVCTPARHFVLFRFSAGKHDTCLGYLKPGDPFSGSGKLYRLMVQSEDVGLFILEECEITEG